MADEPRLAWAGEVDEEGLREFAEARFGELAVADPRRSLFGNVQLEYNPSALVTRRGLTIFDDMRMDDQVKAATVFKKLSVLASGWEIVSPKGENDESEPVRFIADQLDNEDGAFDENLMQVMTALEYGYSVSELVYEKIDAGEFSGLIGLDAIRTKRPHDFDFSADQFGKLLPNGLVQRRTQDGDKRLPVDKFVVWTYQFEFGNYYGRSDLEAAYKPYWIKRNAYQWLAMLLERFGIPPLFALYNPAGLSKQQVADLLTVIKRLQAATSGAIPRRDREALELWAPQLASNAPDVFIPALNMLNQDISRAILMPELIGYTGGNSERGSFARSKTQFGSFVLVVRHLQRQIAGVVNKQIIQRLVDLNFDVDGKYPQLRFLPMTDDLKIKMLTVWNQLVQSGAVAPDPVDEAHVRRSFGMPSRSTPQPEMKPPGEDEPDDAPPDDGDDDDPDEDDGDPREESYRRPQPRHPKGSGRGGQWAPGGTGGGGQIIKSVPLTPTTARAFDGEQRPLKNKLSKLEAGALAEQVTVSYLRQQGFKDADTLNVDVNNFPVDLVHDHRVIEVKGGMVSNGQASQKWRATIGQPGKAERAWLAKASPEQKAAWNAAKRQKIIDRKNAVVSDFSRRMGKRVKGATITTIIDSDRKIVDVYEFPGFHSSIRWNSAEARSAYKGSFRYG